MPKTSKRPSPPPPVETVPALRIAEPEGSSKRDSQTEEKPPRTREGAVLAMDSFSQYLRSLSDWAPLPPETEKALAERARLGDDEARDQLVRHNLRFVISLARKYLSHGIPIEDLVQEGNSGLIQSLNTFNPDLGVPLVHYAAFSILQAIRHGIAHQKRQIRLPVNRTTELIRIQKASGVLAERLGRTPTTAEIASEVQLPTTTVEVLLQASQPEVSLDAPVGTEREGAIPLAERIGVDDNFISEMERESRDEFLRQVLASLPERDARILCLLFGVGCSREHTLEEIGKHYGITRERVRQVRDRALKRLRAAPNASTLRLLWTEEP